MGIFPLSSGFGYLTAPHYDLPPAREKNPSPALAGKVGPDGRTKRSNDSSDSDSGPSAKKPRTESTADTAKEFWIPNQSDDSYADHVLRVGAQTPLSDNAQTHMDIDVRIAVHDSQNRLADQHTADMIRETVLAALYRSATFRAAVSYGIHNDKVTLDNITYRNQYEENPDASSSSAAFEAIQDLRIDDLPERDAQHAPIVPISEAGENSEGQPWVSFSVAPNENSLHMPSWREGLIHEIVHHVTGASDPPGAGTDRLGPTEILARRVAQEMGWSIPDFTGYGDPDRTRHLNERNLEALREAAMRNRDHESAFFERLDTISEGHTADREFSDLGAEAGPGAGRNRTDDSPSWSRSPSPGLPHSLLCFADSSPDGRPTGYPSASAATSASYATQGRFFQYGKPIDGNPHARAFMFPDGSKVVVRAHEPLLTDSDGLKFGRFLTVPAATLAGAATGFVAGNAPGAVVGAVAGAAAGIELARRYPYDRIWQGYTLDYYQMGSAKPFDTQHMYAWDSDPKRVTDLSRIRDPKEWADYAKFNPDKNWHWWAWKAGDAPLRT
ncbi:hypothetical protein CIC12_01770 [Burkholderia sp. SG-MS1]|uniref:M85 family metallopeptidase n=1 Tax=Paraburkholderia sp. SG-MS1 TaxID=2023741 RepID=UPI0014473AF7|nr:M85 family metallopeptidase [Paraburkholderia sp. SG-MS1]NKJ45491.1 hypothetical protein [Paraburkholderia sp. SG-MS1]